jgi:predicted AAA+ superfamily ATPase
MYFGGYPKVVLEPKVIVKEKMLLQIVDTYLRKDILDLGKIASIDKFNKLLKLLAEQSGQQLNISKLASNLGLARATVENYLFLLENTYIIKLLTPFSQSRGVEISKAPKVFFYDTGLNQILRLKTLTKNLVGNTLETAIFGELVKKYGVENLNYWRTKSGNEVDFVLSQNGKIVPTEVKLNFNQFRLGSMKEFLQKYNLESYQVVALEGVKTQNCKYPWEI